MSDIIATQHHRIRITETGLVSTQDATYDDFIATGRSIARIDLALQWLIGDWYNLVPTGDKRAACEAAGIDYGKARVYASIAAAFPRDTRIAGLTFKHHQVAASRADRLELLEQAKALDWSAAQLSREIKGTTPTTTWPESPTLRQVAKQDTRVAQPEWEIEKAREASMRSSPDPDDASTAEVSTGHCGFCLREQHEVRELITWGGTFICDECIDHYIETLLQRARYVSSLVTKLESRGLLPDTGADDVDLAAMGLEQLKDRFVLVASAMRKHNEVRRWTHSEWIGLIREGGDPRSQEEEACVREPEAFAEPTIEEFSARANLLVSAAEYLLDFPEKVRPIRLVQCGRLIAAAEEMGILHNGQKLATRSQWAAAVDALTTLTTD